MNEKRELTLTRTTKSASRLSKKPEAIQISASHAPSSEGNFGAGNDK
jgi:hypothetical protein